jgi:hypothetical protein
MNAIVRMLKASVSAGMLFRFTQVLWITPTVKLSTKRMSMPAFEMKENRENSALDV